MAINPSNRTVLIVAIIGLLASVAAAIAGPVATHVLGDSVTKQNNLTLEAANRAAARLGPAVVSKVAAEWTGGDGNIRVTGKVNRLNVGESVWAFLQPQVGDRYIYPIVGPCVVDNSGGFTCSRGNAAGPAGQSYKVWVGVFTNQSAADIVDHLTWAQVKGSGNLPYKSQDDVPHEPDASSFVSANAGAKPAG